MAILNRLALSLMVATALFQSPLLTSPALAESKVIPRAAVPFENDEAPALDLIRNGQLLDPDHAVDLRKKGEDLSLLDPQATDVWQNTTHIVPDSTNYNYPSENATLDFYADEPNNPSDWYRGQVVSGDQFFRLNISLAVHQGLARAALLRRLGYPIQTPKWYRKLTLNFKTEKALEDFVSSVTTDLRIDPEDEERQIISRIQGNKTQLVLQDIVLEPAQIVVPTAFYQGHLNATHVQGRRTLRALLIPFVLVDITENINMFSWEAAQVLSENVVLTHAYADAFIETTYDDVRWILARLAPLTREDLKAVIDAAQYPPDVGAIVLEKVIARRNNLMALFKMGTRIPKAQMELPYNPKISVGNVVNGKLTVKQYPGYSLRFSWGDPDSPLKKDEIARYIKIEGIGAALNQLLNTANEKLQFFNMDSILQDRSANLQKQFIEHIQKNPRQPFSQPLSTWGGPIGGPILNASRNIVTGSYYATQASDFKVQLVDQISAGIKIGYFMGIDGIPKILPTLGANAILQRSYVHVRPVPSIEAGDKKKWSDLWIPGFMKGLNKFLEKDLSGKTGDERVAQMSDNLGKFLEELKEGETFIITDAINLGANAAISIPLTTLIGLDPLGFVNNVQFGVNGQAMVLRRTTIIRENELLKIYIQTINSQALGVTFDFNYWLSVFHASYNHKWGRAHTKAYHLPEKPTEDKQIRNTVLALTGVLAGNESDILRSKFSPFELDHKTEADIVNGKFLFWRFTHLEESHRVKIRPPVAEGQNFNPADFERTLFSYKKMNRSGRNYYAFLGDVLDGLVQNSTFFKPGLLDSNSGDNPASSFLGRARWNSITTEAETTPGKESRPVAIIENVWAGWNIKKSNLFKVFDGIDAKVQTLNAGIPLINRAVFNDMKKLQLYEIRTTFIVYDEAMSKLRDELLITNNKRGSFFNRLLGWDNFSGKDKDVVTQILIPLYGKERFNHECANPHIYATPNRPINDVSEQGVKYACLLPWMSDVLRLRRKFPVEPEGRVKWVTNMMSVLMKNIELHKLIDKLGKENIFFQVSVTGFRTNDESGDEARYTSNTIGMQSNRDKAGVFKDFVNDYEITANELYANYLSEGF